MMRIILTVHKQNIVLLLIESDRVIFDLHYYIFDLELKSFTNSEKTNQEKILG